MSIRSRYRLAWVVLVVLSCLLGSAQAGPREQAKRLHDRLAGVPPTAAKLDQMAAMIDGGNAIDAAYEAMAHPDFYRVTIKNWATPWTNREQSPFAPLNDYTATVIGMIRDGVPFNRLLTADLVYVAQGTGAPAYSQRNNAHYEWLESNHADLQAVLAPTTQSGLLGIPPQATAGVMTTRAAARAFFYAGTNRAMLRYTLLNHLCRDLEQLQDPTRPADRIRQDVSRSPGGDSRLYLNGCISCHTGMDPLAQAYAYYDWDYDRDADPAGDAGRLIYTAGEVRPKYLINSATFSPGFVTPDDRWDNYWRAGPNKHLGWPLGSGGGYGAKSMGEELAASDAFAQCQVEKAFRAVCLRSPGNSADRAKVSDIAAVFKGGYDMKQVFAQTAVYCMGE